MSPHPNQTPHERTGRADPADHGPLSDNNRHRPAPDRPPATLDIPAGRSSSVGTGISTAVAARVTGRWTGQQFEALLDHVGDCAVFVLDPQGRVLTWNDRAEAVTGYPSDEVVGRHLSVLYPEPAVEAGVPERDLRSAAENDGLEAEGWRVRADGSAFRAETTLTPLPGEELTGFVNVTRDVSDERDAEELRDRIERLEDLVAAASHDLRGPLTAAAGNAELAATTDDPSHLEAVDRALDRAEELLDCLTTLATEGERVRETSTVALSDVARNAWEITETGGATLSVEEETTFPADECRAKQLLENLFKNSVEHGSTTDGASPDDAVGHGSTTTREAPGEDADGPDVTVRVGALPDRPGFYVADDGPGVPAGDRERVFESGYSTSEDGTGFGLAIVRTIAEAHDWTVDLVESETGGARFEISTGRN